MTHTVPLVDRRRLLGLLPGLPFLWRARPAFAFTTAFAAPAFPDTATIMVAGPTGGDLDQWSGVMVPALAKSLPPGTPLRRVTTGAPDGVTGANQFNANSLPDGGTVLLAPGEAALTWMVGDPRAQYDISRWVTVMAVITPGLVITHPGALALGRTVRIATAGPATADLPAILGIELLGARVQPLPAIAEDAQAASFARGAVDAVFLRGHKVKAQATALFAAGGKPAFSLGTLDGRSGEMTRCSVFPDAPTLDELYGARPGQSSVGPLFDAWRAAAVAAQVECALVLPQLTPAAMVALWRTAGETAASTLDVQSVALSLGVRAVGGAEATATAGAVVANDAALTDLRGWLATRFGWHPV